MVVMGCSGMESFVPQLEECCEEQVVYQLGAANRFVTLFCRTFAAICWIVQSTTKVLCHCTLLPLCMDDACYCFIDTSMYCLHQFHGVQLGNKCIGLLSACLWLTPASQNMALYMQVQLHS